MLLHLHYPQCNKRETRDAFLASALRVKFRLGVISSFGIASFRYFAWLFSTLGVVFSRHFVFSRRKDSILPREKRNNQKMPREIKKRRNDTKRKDEKKPQEETKSMGFKWRHFTWRFFSSFRAFCVIYVSSCGVILYFVFSFFRVPFVSLFPLFAWRYFVFSPCHNHRQKDDKN